MCKLGAGVSIVIQVMVNNVSYFWVNITELFVLTFVQ